MTTRRSLLFGLGASLIAVPAIVRATSLMPVRSLGDEVWWSVSAIDEGGITSYWSYDPSMKLWTRLYGGLFDESWQILANQSGIVSPASRWSRPQQTWDYNVEDHHHDAILKADSIGGYFHKHIKPVGGKRVDV